MYPLNPSGSVCTTCFDILEIFHSAHSYNDSVHSNIISLVSLFYVFKYVV
jgi:hypothetical protein